MNKPPSEDKKSKYPPPFSMRFTDDERRVLELAADGRPLAAYIRWLIFKEDMPELPKRRTREQMADRCSDPGIFPASGILFFEHQ